MSRNPDLTLFIHTPSRFTASYLLEQLRQIPFLQERKTRPIQFIFLSSSYTRDIFFTIVAAFCAKDKKALRIPQRALIVASYYA